MTATQRFIRWPLAAAISAGLLLAQGPGAGLGPRAHAWGAERFERLAAYLDLTEAQKAQAKPAIEAAFAQAKPVLEQLKKNREAIEALVKSGPSPQFDQQLQKLAADSGALVSQLIALHAKTMAQLLGLLTPEQRAKAEELRRLFAPPGFGLR